jgi:hypothetical protein
MKRSVSGRWLMRSAAVVSTLFGCSSAPITAPNLSNAAHSIASSTNVAYGDMAACTRADASPTDCSGVTNDLCAILQKATELEALALDAGFTPAAPIQTISACSKK